MCRGRMHMGDLYTLSYTALKNEVSIKNTNKNQNKQTKNGKRKEGRKREKPYPCSFTYTQWKAHMTHVPAFFGP